MNTIDRSDSRLMSSIRLRICARTETSRAETASSATIRSGSTARAGDGDALPLAAAELVRIEAGVTGAEADARQQRSDAFLHLAPAAESVEEQRLAELVAYAETRIEGRERVLEHHLHAAAPVPQLSERKGRAGPRRSDAPRRMSAR
jgi:hypothetical protein